MLTHLSVFPICLDREWDGMLPKSKAITSKTQRHHFQTATASLPWSLPKLNGITSKTQRYHFPNSTASLPESLPNQSHQFQNSTTSLPWSLPKLIAITSKTQRHQFQIDAKSIKNHPTLITWATQNMINCFKIFCRDPGRRPAKLFRAIGP